MSAPPSSIKVAHVWRKRWHEPDFPVSAASTYAPTMARPIAQPRPKQGHRLASLRKEAGLSQTELASAVGVSQQTVAYWETAATPPRSDVLPKMAKALGVRVEDILSDTPIHAVRKPGPVGKLQVPAVRAPFSTVGSS
jgi:DNA-binding XRE family transcriptional regulator